MSKYILISGASSGLAQSLIDELIKEDYIIIATDIVDTSIKNSKVIYIHMDVTSEESVQNAYNEVLKITDELYSVINFAGSVILGSMVELSTNNLEKIININLIGMYRVNQIFFPMIKKAKGRYINISSEYGVLDAIPFHTFYTLSKHAVEVYNDGLRRELKGQGIKVIKIRPGAFKTKMQAGIGSQFNNLVDETKLYKEPLLKMKHIMDKELQKAKHPKKFVKVALKAVNSKRPKLCYKVNNSLKMKLLSVLPDRLQDYIYYKFLKGGK